MEKAGFGCGEGPTFGSPTDGGTNPKDEVGFAGIKVLFGSPKGGETNPVDDIGFAVDGW